MEAVIRVLPYAEADGAANMAADEVMVHSAAGGVVSLRLYGWTRATVSLGYFQPAQVRTSNERLKALPWVRRPSGGALLVHHHELTYAIALPHGSPWSGSEPWMSRMHRIIRLALTELGADEKIQAVPERVARQEDVLCFQQHTPGDVLCAGNKIVGSAQRKYRQALLQHGSLLLRQSEFTPELPGLQELTGISPSTTELSEILLASFAKDTGWHMIKENWTAEEQTSQRKWIDGRYASDEWNRRR